MLSVPTWERECKVGPEQVLSLAQLVASRISLHLPEVTHRYYILWWVKLRVLKILAVKMYS